MRIEDVIEVLNQYIKDTRDNLGIDCDSFLVIRKYTEIGEKFKLYKTITIEVIIVDTNDKKLLLTESYSGRILSNTEDEVSLILERHIIKALFKIVNSELFTSIVKGEYNENIIRN